MEKSHNILQSCTQDANWFQPNLIKNCNQPMFTHELECHFDIIQNRSFEITSIEVGKLAGEPHINLGSKK